MAWFREQASQPPTAADAKRLQATVIYVVGEFARHQKGASRKRAQELVQRLQRFPVPTGLDQQVRKLGPMPKTGSIAGSGDAGMAMEAVLGAMRRVCIAEPELEGGVQRLVDLCPKQFRPGDGKRLTTAAEELAKLAEPARRRMIDSRREMVRMLEDMGMHLGKADGSADRLDGHVGRMLSRLRQANDPESLRAARKDLAHILGEMQAETARLRGDLLASRDRTRRMEQVTRSQAQELETVRAEAVKDPLTGVCNRAHFDRVLPTAMATAKSRGKTAALLVLDIDLFKAINDNFGHPAGDDVLRAVAARVRKLLRDGDEFSRIGGEEFAVVLPATTKRGALQVAERLREGIARLKFTHLGQPFKVTVSIGVALQATDEAPAELYARADRALYAAKRDGRNQSKAA